MATADYYELLGVSRDASEAEIKRAFRQLAMKHHPDRNPGDKGAEERFKVINEAYAILSDPDRRAQYDRFGRADLPPGGIDLGGFGDLFEDIFEGFFTGGARGARSRIRRGDDLRYDLEITLEEAAKGVETRLMIPRLESCEACKGSGVELIHRDFLNALERIGVRPFGARGESFDPQRHEAVGRVERADVADHTVVDEMQRGYLFHDRVLRPAQVVVAVEPLPPDSGEAAS